MSDRNEGREPGAEVPRRRRPARSLGFVILCLLGLALPVVPLEATRAAAGGDALEVAADLVLMETRCSGLTVDYGRVFAFLSQNGIAPAEIMPTGARRPAFEAVMKRRAKVAVDTFCGPLAAERQSEIPGVFVSH